MIRTSVLIGACAAVLAAPPAGGAQRAPVPRVADPERPAITAPRAVAFLINGYTGCCIPKRVRDFLKQHPGVVVYEGNWNDLERRRNPGGFNPREVNTSDEYFIGQMQAAIAQVPEATPIIIIGHSFGGDAVLQVVKRVRPRRIAFLAVLDPVGRGGLRQNLTWPVPVNVDYFFNRWQQNPPFPADAVTGNESANVVPFDALTSGKIKGNSQARRSEERKQNTEKTAACRTKHRDPAGVVPQLLSHSELPNDGCIQTQIIDFLRTQVLR